MKRLGSVSVALLLTVSGLDAQETSTTDSLQRIAEAAPLFASHGLLELRIEAPLKTIFEYRGEESEYHPGTLSYIDDSGDSVVLDIRARTRGYFRLRRSTCGFPNLHINFRRRQVENTLFAGLNRVPIVAHCQDRRAEYEQFTLQEYLIYRTFSLLTDRGVRVRLARTTYVDTEGERDPITKFMFFLEPFEMVAARHGWEVLEVPFVPPNQQDHDALLLFEMFQFLIGNTDWSSTQSANGEPCCHNAKIIGTMAGPVIPVPYDFDWSGVISPPYAFPDPAVEVSSVRERRYWGICRPAEEFDPVFDLFNEHKDVIFDLWRGQEGLQERKLDHSMEYFEDFYEIINDAGRTRREILEKCRRVSYEGG
jgi:hypothetical protein